MVEENRLKNRLVILFEGLTVPKIAEKMDVPYATLTNWVTKRTDFPSDELAKIARLTEGSLTWLLTGEGDIFINKSDKSFEEIFDNKIRRVVRDEIIKGAVAYKETVDSDESFVVLDSEFSPTLKEKLSAIADRIEKAFATRNKEQSVRIMPPLQKAIERMKAGEIPEQFGHRIYDAVNYTHHTIKWLLLGEGDKRFKPISETKEESSAAEALLNEFKNQLLVDQERDKKLQLNRKEIAKQNELRRTIREIIREELQKQSKTMTLPVDVGKKINQEDKAA